VSARALAMVVVLKAPPFGLLVKLAPIVFLLFLFSADLVITATLRAFTTAQANRVLETRLAAGCCLCLCRAATRFTVVTSVQWTAQQMVPPWCLAALMAKSCCGATLRASSSLCSPSTVLRYAACPSTTVRDLQLRP
jgi:hypothetical protein